MPFMAYVAVLFTAGIRGRWRELACWIALSVVCAVGVAVPMLLHDRRYIPFADGEKYTWTQWYLLALFMAAITGWLMIVTKLGWSGIRMAWRQIRRFPFRQQVV